MDIDSYKVNKVRGFTLLELLIVIAIIAILSVILIIVINPAETLKKARDSQRLSDLGTLKTALGIYLTSKTAPDLDAALTTFCYTDTVGTGATSASPQIGYSSDVADVVCTGGATVLKGTDGVAGAFTLDFCKTLTTTTTLVDGTGWLPVDLSSLTGGPPISNMPLDPVNTTITTLPTNADLVYRYACQNKSSTKPPFVFELNAILESTAFTVDDNKMSKDGGDNTLYYEVGNSVKLIGTGTNF